MLMFYYKASATKNGLSKDGNRIHTLHKLQGEEEQRQTAARIPSFFKMIVAIMTTIQNNNQHQVQSR